MRAHAMLPALLTIVALAAGCTSVAGPVAVRALAPTDRAEPPKDVPTTGKDAESKDKKDETDDPPPTLFEWKIGPPVEKKDDEPEPIVTDRPDFTEASSTVGMGRVQLEAGYTFIRDRVAGTTRIDRSYPEALLRIGAFADWFELRFGQNYRSSRTSFGIPTESLAGPGDFYTGTKLGLAEQRGYLPELAVILQATFPTGARAISQNQVLAGVNLLFSWEVVKDLFDIGGSIQANRAVDDDRHPYIQMAQSITFGYTITSKFGAYTEWFAFYPTGTTAVDTTAQHFFNGGFTYKLTPDFQLDIRAGWGLTKSAEDFFAGAGFSVRY